MDFRLRRARFADLPGWADDDPSPLFAAMSLCRDHIQGVKPYRTGALGLTSEDLLPALTAAEGMSGSDAAAARSFFEQHFVPFHILPSSGAGLVTAYYEPEVAVQAVPDADYRYPFYRRPADLVDVDETNRPDGMDPYFAFGRRGPAGGIAEYPDRNAIEAGLLTGKGLEIAYARSKVDVFFAHIQGAARLVYPDGQQRRITYAAKTGHRFSAIGKLLIERGEIAPADISMASIRAWLAAHPDEADAVMGHNRSFIFFREAEVDDLELGPIAAAKVPLVAGRSLAVDRLIHTFGTPFFIDSPSLTHLDGGRPFRRLMLALDTGSAITGPARGDLFTGSGDAAGVLAGNVRNEADFYILLPKQAARRYGHGEG